MFDSEGRKRKNKLPVGILCVGARREFYLFVGTIERDVKPCKEGVYIYGKFGG